jgi:signal transduction histidine kinase
VPIGFSTEIVILSFALVYNYNFLEKKHQELSIRLTRQQLTFSQQLLQVQDDEQKRIAQDLHDELGGNLAVIKMNLQELKTENSNDGEESVAKIIQMVDKVSDNARHIAHNLMPPEFENTKLDILLKNFFSKINNENSVRFYFHFPPGEDRFEKQDELMIYRVILELTNNILRHSQASEATVQFIYYDTYLEIMAEDNGKGFGDSTVDGMGIKNIQSRVNYLQGQLDIDSGIRGTTIVIKVPYKN